MALIALVLLASCLVAQAGASGGQDAGWGRSPPSRGLLAEPGGLGGLVFPLDHTGALSRPRGLLRNGTLPIHGAVRDGCAALLRAPLSAPARCLSGSACKQLHSAWWLHGMAACMAARAGARGAALQTRPPPRQRCRVLRQLTTLPAPRRRSYFYAKLSLGTPPRTFSTIIDTGGAAGSARMGARLPRLWASVAAACPRRLARTPIARPTPPSPARAAGSTITYIPCAECKQCGKHMVRWRACARGRATCRARRTLPLHRARCGSGSQPVHASLPAGAAV